MSTKVLTKIGPFCSAPMRVLTAAKEADDDDTDLKTVCEGTTTAPHPAIRVHQRYKCTYTHTVKGKPVSCTVEHSSYHPFPRGRENLDNTFTVPSADELAAANKVDNDIKDTLTLMRCPKDQVDEKAIPNGKFYYLGVGDGPGRENYGVIRDQIRADLDEFVWLTVWAYRTAPSLVKLVLIGDCLGLQQIAWPAQVQQLPNVGVGGCDERWAPLVAQAAELVTVDFDPASFTDVRKAKIAEMLAAAPTVEGADVPSTPVATPDGAIADLAAWIEKSKTKTVGGKGKTAKKTVDAPPVQALPDPVPDNVTIATPKKRAPRKAAAVKKTA